MRKSNLFIGKEEKEIKYLLEESLSLEKVFDFFKSIGFYRVRIENQKDVYWDDTNLTITNYKRGLRLRFVDRVLVSVEFKSLFERHDGSRLVEEVSLMKDGKYDFEKLKWILVERMGVVSVDKWKKMSPSGNDIERVLSDLGLSPEISLIKKRTVFEAEGKEVEVGVDQIQGINTHLEIENKDGEMIVFDELVAKIENKFPKAARVKYGYLDLIFQRNPKILSKEFFEEKYKSNYSWNVQTGEKEYVNKLLSQKG